MFRACSFRARRSRRRRASNSTQSNAGRLFRIDPATGVTRAISLGTESVPNGDGILLTGKTLYVVQNQRTALR